MLNVCFVCQYSIFFFCVFLLVFLEFCLGVYVRVIFVMVHGKLTLSSSLQHTFTSLNTSLKMLGLYLYTLRISHKSCNMLSTLNNLASLKELQIFVTNNVFLDKNKKNTTTTKQKSNIKNPCRSWGFNPGTLAPKADALPLHHRVK